MYYKFLNADGRAPYSGAKYHLPKGSRPGKWMPKVAKLEMCESGYHACREKDLINWIDARLFECELGGEILEFKDKVCAQRIRLVREIKLDWRGIAVEFAEHVAHLYTEDETVNCCLYYARLYLLGKCTRKELREARDAAWAVDAAGWAVDAAGAVDAAYCADGAACCAVRAAGDAAERRWQNELILAHIERVKTCSQ